MDNYTSLVNTRKSKFHFSILLNLLQLCKGIIKTLAVVLLVFCTVCYYQTVIFDFAESKPFTGNSFYNPYTNWDPDNQVKANFHAHSKAWLGLTNGANSDQELKSFYTKAGYKVAAISNYHKAEDIASENLIDFPVYEHGYNILKSHRLALGTRKLSHLDYPFWQNRSHKQLLINNIKENDGLVALAHPNLRSGYNYKDMALLEGYDFVEVLSNYANAISYWDEALKHGKAVWCMANDDSHSITNQRTGEFYNVLSTDLITSSEIRKVLLEGNFVSVRKPEAELEIRLNQLKVNNDSLEYDFEGELDQLRVIADGKTIQSHSKSAGVIFLKDEYSYVRLEATKGEQVVLTNPVIRSKSRAKPWQESTVKVNGTLTFFYRIYVLFFSVSILFLLFKKRVRKFLQFEVKLGAKKAM